MGNFSPIVSNIGNTLHKITTSSTTSLLSLLRHSNNHNNHHNNNNNNNNIKIINGNNNNGIIDNKCNNAQHKQPQSQQEKQEKQKQQINADEAKVVDENTKTSELLFFHWDFSNLIQLKKSGCVLHWLLYLQKLYLTSEHCHSPCEIVCDSHGIIQIQPIDHIRSKLTEYEHEHGHEDDEDDKDDKDNNYDNKKKCILMVMMVMMIVTNHYH